MGGTHSGGSVFGSGSPRFVCIVRCIATANQSASSLPALPTSTSAHTAWSVAVGSPERLSTGATFVPGTLPSSGCICRKIVSYFARSASLTAHGASLFAGAGTTAVDVAASPLPSAHGSLAGAGAGAGAGAAEVDPDLALALQMSMQDQGGQGAGAGAGNTDQGALAQVMGDQAYMQGVLGSLPGVDPNAPGVQATLQRLSEDVQPGQQGGAGEEEQGGDGEEKK